jgi:hypothetical protein
MIRGASTQRNPDEMAVDRLPDRPDPSVRELLDVLYTRGFMGASDVAEHFDVEISRARVLLLTAQAQRLTYSVDAGDHRLTRQGNDVARVSRLAAMDASEAPGAGG